jgi:transcriptional regulator with XRE-family HTH domain
MGKYDPAPTVAAGLVRLARSKSGLTQAELAERAGVSQQTVSAYETGRMDPTVTTLLKLVEAAGLELRFQLESADNHDASLERYLDSLDPETRELLERRQRERVDAARLERVRGR